ncbi:hypothetical protein MRB53_032862 [Persea americana]|uniref:Uncharacterized protein n=1 Tax=Persea americana TaxID=3435 RepID=A0ACC2KU39_PERAE|nr:hypothetical protein MRB53_032862 [Persea americana]
MHHQVAHRRAQASCLEKNPSKSIFDEKGVVSPSPSSPAMITASLFAVEEKTVTSVGLQEIGFLDLWWAT